MPKNETNAIIHGIGVGSCSLTGKETDGLTVTLGNGRPRFLSWKAFRQIVTMEVGQNEPVRPNGQEV